MKIEAVKKLSVSSRLLYWIQEREKVRQLKEAGAPKPWTDDEVLQRYRFCNVRRMDDKVSRWLFENWYQPNFDHRNMLLACALARFINLPASLEVIGFPTQWRPDEIKSKLRKYRDQGNQVFNGAYMVRGNDGMDKIECVVDYYVQPLFSLRDSVNTDSMEETWKTILPSYGMGSFMAGQIVADLRWALEGRWKDAKTWAPMGPGSKRGMNRLLEKPLNAPMTQAEFESDLKQMMAVLRQALPRTLAKRLEAIDYQNCLCELDKYERTLFEGRRPKSRYPGDL